ncbi:PNP-UDP-1 domain-containing protein [Fusarium falciforme]|uniref:PNP-UDP-1 domain-containing protein n=1 Tax=Fusarium falciforme TaxID=195108 RepID=UPI0022FFF349|nr:PNP-UDP-1 domain-containing protein [Fusarium falciforme]WAO97377.1 PNP-UDP-1 domain-containing protein [Fusarium falciforme]
MAMLDEIHPDPPKHQNDHNNYILGSIGSHNIVIACLPLGKIGTNPAATVAARMMSTFPAIKVGHMVGIGGGIPSSGVRLGDVVVGTPDGIYPGVVQWDSGKAETEGFKRTGALNNPPTVLSTAATRLYTKHEMQGSKIPQYLDDLKRNWPKLASRYYWSASFTDPLVPDGRPGKPEDLRVHYGLIASGNQVIRDEKFRDRLNQQLGGRLLCVEMEAAGLMNDFPCLVIRGICDYADSEKSKEWQEYAAAVAAAYARELLETLQPGEVIRERFMEDILNQIGESASKLEAKMDREQNSKSLNWLTSVDYSPQYNNFLTRVQSGTGQWLVQSPEYQAWLGSSGKTLFCSGIPGAGKTMLATIIISDILERFRHDTSVGIAFIYGDFQRIAQQTPVELLSSLLEQLGNGGFGLKTIQDLHDRHEYRRTRPEHDEIHRLLHSVAKHHAKVFIIVDALDELQVSDGSLAVFLDDLFSLQQMDNVFLFATSRNKPSITRRFDNGLRLEIQARKEDVEKYLDGRMEKLLPWAHEDKEMGKLVKNKIVQSTQGMFLLAQLHLNALVGKTTLKGIKTYLNSLPTGSGPQVYQHVYDDAMRRISDQPSEREKLAIEVLSWLTLAQRPMTTTEIQLFLAVEHNQTHIDPENLPGSDDMVAVCAGLVTVDAESDAIRLVHYTAQEYFETRLDWIATAEAYITKVCLAYLSLDYFEDEFWDKRDSELVSWWRQKYWGGYKDEAKDFEHDLTPPRNGLKPAGKVMEAYEYASKFWGHHAYRASEVDQDVLLFLEKQSEVKASWRLLHNHGLFTPAFIYGEEDVGILAATYFGLDRILNLLLRDLSNGDTPAISHATPLAFATYHGHEKAALVLIENGAGVNGMSFGQPVLVYAVQGGHMEVIVLLLNNGADVDAETPSGRTPLTFAVEQGDKEIVQVLLEHSAKLNYSDKGGRYPMYWTDNRDMIDFLFKKGACGVSFFKTKSRNICDQFSM